MHKIITLILATFFSTHNYAQEKKGIYFRTHIANDFDIENSFDLAKKEGKDVFLYFYVPECNTCDWVSKDFGNKSLGKFYNDFYLSYALDASGTGKTMAEYYGVFSFPTMLYISPNGDVKYSVRGYRDGKTIFETGKLARQSNKEIKTVMDRKYKTDPTNTDHLFDYIEYQFVRKDFKKANKLIKEYLNQRENIEPNSWMNLVLDYALDPDSYPNEILRLEKDRFIKEFGAKLINETIWNSLIIKVGQKTRPNDIVQFEKKFISAATKAGYKPKDDELIIFYSKYLNEKYITSQVRQSSKNMAVFSRYALAPLFIKDHIFERAHLVSLGIYLICNDQKRETMEKLNAVLDTNFKKDPNHSYLDLQSVVLYTLGKEDAAVEKIVQARELALNEGVKNFKPSITEFKKQGIVK